MTPRGDAGTVPGRERPGGYGDLRPTARARVAITAAMATVLLILGTSGPSTATADPNYRVRLLRLVNDVRERHDLAALSLDRGIARDALRHTRRMIREERVFDPPDLHRILRSRRHHLGAATVGCAPSLEALRRAWMRSDEHRAILLHPDLQVVGFGVIRPSRSTDPCGTGALWATGIYYG